MMSKIYVSHDDLRTPKTSALKTRARSPSKVTPFFNN